ncbi:MAG: M24 family metallopeptidase [Clostridia bacterium]|nr:M24 family metallopeptidase [Clostridia bacterium]
MKNHNISAAVIPTADMHLSEYISDRYKLREYISGFTGSAGTLVVTEGEAGLWTDGRYYIQAERELSQSGIKLFRASEKDCVKIHEFIKDNLSKTQTVGLDGRLFSKKGLDELISNLEDIHIDTDYDPAEIWEDRPLEAAEKIFLLDEKYCGESIDKKLFRVRELMEKESFTHYLVSSPECIMWLLNIRGNDVRYTPVALSFLLMTKKTVTLYVNNEKVNDEVSEYLKLHNIELADYSQIYRDVKEIGENSYLAADFSLVNYSLLKNPGCAVKNISDFIYNLKCIKNETETENIKKAYIKENIALTKSFYEIYHSDQIDECDVTQIIEKYRYAMDGYISPSFKTIAAVGANAAMMHYCPEKGKCAKIVKNGMLLIDTGGQYLEGTTDTTRTLVMGNLSCEESENLTLVLKSHISMAMAAFPEETRCCEIDAIARMPLWQRGLDYRCGTGHGVGYLLSVHEGPQRLSALCEEKLCIGMTVTDEPGVYTEGKYGIRIENHLCVGEAFHTQYGKFLKFEVLNFCPIGTSGICADMLNKDEKKWLNDYNKKCREILTPHLTKEESSWLISYTAQI